MIYGLTGGIATGKSTVVTILREMGYFIIDSDKIAAEVIENDKIKNKIKDNFPAVYENGILDRAKLRNEIADSKEKREKLNKIMHPEILERIRVIVNENKGKDVIIDMPLLFEVGYETQVDKVIVVYTDRETQITRLAERAMITYSEAEQLTAMQIDINEKLKRADIAVDNNGTVCELKDKIKSIMKMA